MPDTGSIPMISQAIMESVHPHRKKMFSSLKEALAEIVDKPGIAIITGLLTLYALIGDDLKMALTQKSMDSFFDTFTLVVLVVFSIEIVINSIAKEKYLFGFFFWLDMIATTSLLIDISWVGNAIFYNEELTTADATGSQGQDNAQVMETAKASKASRVGSKAGRVLRIVRLMRMVKLYKTIKEFSQKDDPNNPLQKFSSEVERPVESRVGKKLTERTTRKVILLVLGMLVCIPFFDIDSSYSQSPQILAQNVHESWKIWQCATLETVSDRCKDILGARQYQTLPGANILKAEYERSLLKFIYKYEWNNREAAGINASMFWIGVPDPIEELAEENLEESWSGIFNITIPAVIRSRLTRNGVDGHPNFEASLMTCNVGSADEPALIQGISLAKDLTPGSSDGCPLALRRPAIDKFPEAAYWLWPQQPERLYFFFDKRRAMTEAAWLSMLQTLFVCVVLSFVSLSFSRDANILVINPIESMIEKVSKIRENPLYATIMGDEEFKKEKAREKEFNRRIKEAQKSRFWFFRKHFLKSDPQRKNEPLETQMLEKTITKLGALLALGFGEAGAEVVAQNMKRSDAAMNPMIAGKHTVAIFGLCNIEDFTVATEILQDQVLVFVNQIGQIVHGIVSEFHGVANKNMGHAFLLVWRLTGIESIEERREAMNKAGNSVHTFNMPVGITKCPPEKRRERMAELAVMSFCKINAAIGESLVLAEYRSHPGFLQRIPNYRVKTCFGLHAGWAIEGAIGSEFKVDASYLSPHVQVASQLESLTKIYKVDLLISGDLVKMMGESMQSMCRHIDNVLVSGSTEVLELYTIDQDLSACLPQSRYSSQNEESPLAGVGRPSAILNSDQHYEHKRKLDEKKSRYWNPTFHTAGMFKRNPILKKTRALYGSSPTFFNRFHAGFLNYEAGEWEVAQTILEETQYMLQREDGPSTRLLEYMESFEFQAPKGWKGFREVHL